MSEQHSEADPTFEHRFEKAFERLLRGEKLDLYASEANLSWMFEVIATHLMAEIPARRHHWYDGVVDLTARRRKARQLEFRGEMWVSDVGNVRMQWKEKFRSTVTNKQAAGQGIWIIIWLGDDRVEGDLALLNA